MKKNGGTTLPGGRVSRQSQKVRGWLQPFSFFFWYFKSPFWKIYAYYDAETYRTCLNCRFPSVYAKKPGFSPVLYEKIAIFRFRNFLWRHNYLTPCLSVLILVCVARGVQYLSIDTKTKFIGVQFRKSREGLLHPLWLDVLQKIAWLDEG